jgi:predicted GNAT family acetyltransferase
MEILHEPATREFVGQLDRDRAVLQYDLADGVMTITHTRVPEGIRNRGVAAALTRTALDAARAAGWKVVPQCLYALAFLRSHAEYADLFSPNAAADAQRRHVDGLLDEALEESFPASDVPAVGGFGRTSRAP